MKRSRLVAPAAFVLALTGSSSQGGLYYPPPSDTLPLVSHDGSAVAFYRSGNPGEPTQPGLHVMRPDGTGERQLPGLPANPSFALSRTWHWIAFSSYDRGAAIVVMRPDGSERRTVFRADVGDFVMGITWAPDEERLAFVRRDGVWTIRIDGRGLARVGAGAMPAWSPDGTQLAFQVGEQIALAAPDGSNLRVIGHSASFTPPVWSPNGAWLAYISSNNEIDVVTADGRRVTRYLVHAGASGLAWTPDSQRLAYAALGKLQHRKFVGRGVWELTLAKHTLASQRLLLGAAGPGPTIQPAFGGGLSWAPDERWLFASSGGICRDRAGIYRIDVAHHTAARLTNDCRLRGTSSADDISGTPVYDILLGYGGDDHLVTNDGNYQGDDAYGGPGDDELYGGWWPNTLDGGPGNDVIRGGPSRDTITGGPGRDELYGEGGSDHIYARDGARDLVDCGWNNASTGPDTAWVDARDVVRNCQRVVRG